MNNQGLEALATLASAVPEEFSQQGKANEAKKPQWKPKATGAAGLPSASSSSSSTPASTPIAASGSVASSSQALQNAAQLFQQSVTGAQQWQQAVAVASGAAASQQQQQASANLALLVNLQQQLSQGASAQGLLAMQQQLGSFPLPQQTKAPPSTSTACAPNHTLDTAAQALSLALAGRPQATLSSLIGSLVPQVLPTAPQVGAPIPAVQPSSNMPPPSTTIPTAIAPALDSDDDAANANDAREHPFDDKKRQKRAANRRSAQMSRKRKKLFIEELKDENDGLRRKEQILMSIPDLVVVFDSSGKLWFVSNSVSRFLNYTAAELEGTSFWSRLCDNSVRLLKAAFMDSLAGRQSDSDTAPLGSGFWEIRLVDRKGQQKVVTLNGVVHFAGDRPECVCSIRPAEPSRQAAAQASATEGKTVQPNQSVVSHEKVPRKEAMRISDGNTTGSSGCSDSGSSDDLIADATEIASVLG